MSRCRDQVSGPAPRQGSTLPEARALADLQGSIFPASALRTLP
jgi:hypothetical protein